MHNAKCTMHFMRPIVPTSRLPSVGVSIFTVMSRLAEEHGAINLAQGFPDFDAAPELTALAGEWFARGCNQYAPMAGVLRLREELARQIERAYGAPYDPVTEITVTAGASEALFSAITALVHPGDEVLLFEPCYDSYVPAVQLAGGAPVFATLRHPHYAIDWDEVRQLVSPRTRLVVLNTPHNPTGTMWSADDLRQLASLLDGSGVLVLSDEVYEHLTFDGRRHASPASVPALASRTAVVSSFGKTFHTTGWKIGYVSAPPAITDEIRRVHQFVTFAVNTPGQHAMSVALSAPEAYFQGFLTEYRNRRDRLCAGLREAGLAVTAPAGTYFAVADIRPLGYDDAVAFCRMLPERFGVAAIPVSAFYARAGAAPHLVRFAFCKTDAMLDEGVRRLRRLKADAA
jgi:methionine aminotransferase